MAKATGAAIKRFMEQLPEEAWIDDSAIDSYDEEGEFCLNLSSEYDLGDLGYLEGPGGFSVTVKDAFLLWNKDQTMVSIAIEIPKEQEEQARAMLREWGYLK
jgi:hypothetical protein